MNKLPIFLIFALVLLAGSVSAGTYTFRFDSATNASDTELDQSQPAVNLGTDARVYFGISGDPWLHRVLINLNWTCLSIPPGETITAVNLTIFNEYWSAANDDNAQVAIHPINKTWTETDATWNSMNANYNETMINTTSITFTAVNQNKTIGISPSWYEAECAKPIASRYGIMLKDEEAAGSKAFIGFTSSDSATTGQHMVLVVKTTITSTPPTVNIVYPSEGEHINSNFKINGTVTLGTGTNVTNVSTNSSIWSINSGPNNNLTFIFNNQSTVNSGTYTIEVNATDNTGLSGKDIVTFTVDLTPSVITLGGNNYFNSNNGTINQSSLTLRINYTASDNAIVNKTGFNISLGGILRYNFTNLTVGLTSKEIFKSIDLRYWDNGVYDVTIFSWDNLQETRNDYTFNHFVYSLDNCSNYTYPILNYSFYRNILIPTTADSLVNITADFGGGSASLSHYFYGKYSNQICAMRNFTNATLTGAVYYTGTWTDSWVYDSQIEDEPIYINPLVLNLTIPKLYLNFSEATDVTLIDQNSTKSWNTTTILIAMSDIAIGKVSVRFNEGKQYFEYYNDWNTFINEDLQVRKDLTTYINIKVQDQFFGILDNAITDIYEVRPYLNTTYFIDRIYGNNEKQIILNSTKSYIAISTLSGYTHDGGFTTFTPAELSTGELLITMKQSAYNSIPYIYANYGRTLAFADGVPAYYDVTIYVKGQEMINTGTWTWTWNGNETEVSIMEGSKTQDSKTKRFYSTDDNLSVVVSMDNYTTTLWFVNVEREERYEGDFYSAVLYSKLAFAIFFIITISVAISVHRKFKNYGILTATLISSIMSFINLWMLILAIPLIIGLIGKRNISDEI